MPSLVITFPGIQLRIAKKTFTHFGSKAMLFEAAFQMCKIVFSRNKHAIYVADDPWHLGKYLLHSALNIAGAETIPYGSQLK